MSEWVVFCDIDSTLADTRHRQTGQTEGVDWNAYAMQSGNDGLIEGVAVLLRVLSSRGVPIILMSVRWDGARDLTKWWLDHHHVPYDWLTLADETPDSTTEVAAWKVRKVEEWLARLGPKWEALVIEDSAPSVEALKAAGFKTILVQPPVREPV